VGRQFARHALRQPFGGTEGGAALTCVTPADLGRPIAAIVQRCGIPASVGCSRTGNHLLYDGAPGGTDVLFDADDTAILALDFQQRAPERLALNVGAHAFTFAFGVTTLPDAQSQLSDVADVSGTSWAAYRVDARVTLVAQFDSATGTLQRLTLGKPATLKRLGVLPVPLGEPALDYVPPRIRGTLPLAQPANRAGNRATIVRIDVDRYGISRHVTVIVPSSDRAFDDALVTRLDDVRFEPATLSGRTIASTDFALVTH
jgi:hypothetical protein